MKGRARRSGRPRNQRWPRGSSCSRPGLGRCSPSAPTPASWPGTPRFRTRRAPRSPLSGVRWRVTATGGWSSPRPLVRGGEVVVGTKNGEVVAFSLNGREVWRLHLEGEVRGLGFFQDVLFVGPREGA